MSENSVNNAIMEMYRAVLDALLILATSATKELEEILFARKQSVVTE